MAWKAIELSGTRIAAFARTLVLARLLVPEDFGLIAIALATNEFTISLTNFGMRQALVQRADLEEAHYHTAWTFEIVRAVVVGASIFIAAPLIASGLFGEPAATDIIRAIAVLPVLNHFASIKTVTLERDLRFQPLAVLALSGAAVHAVIAVVLAPTLGVWALVIGLQVGAAVETVLSYIVAPHRVRISFSQSAARPLFAFGRWIWITEMVDMAGAFALSAVIAHQVGADGLGVYYLATRLALLPSSTIRLLVGNVAFPVHALLQDHEQRAQRLFRSSISAMWAMLVPIYGVAIVLAPGLVEHVLGSDWSGAAPVIRLLAVGAIINVLADATVPMFQGRGHTWSIAQLFAIRSGVILSLAWWLAGLYGESGAALSWVAGTTAGSLFAVRRAQRLIRGVFQGLAARLVAIAASGGAGVGAAFLVDQQIAGLVGVLGAAAIGVATPIALLWWFDRRFDLGLAEELAFVFPRMAGWLST